MKCQSEFKGALPENYVLGEFLNLHGDIPKYWKSANTAEVDFVFRVFFVFKFGL